jgi:hypothetical protein
VGEEGGVSVTCIFSFILVAGEGDMHPTGSQLQHIFAFMNAEMKEVTFIFVK